MENRKKLSELIACCNFEPVKVAKATIGSRFSDSFIKSIADHLADNGVAIPVRCYECWKHDRQECPMSGTPGYTIDYDFCSYGERKDKDA